MLVFIAYVWLVSQDASNVDPITSIIAVVAQLHTTAQKLA